MEKWLLAGRYELMEKLGSGGMATVYKARCRILDRIVAVKVLNSDLASDPNLVGRFKSEALAAARLSHPNLVNIFDVGEDNGVHYIVMECVEGTTLKNYIKERAPVAPREAVRIASLVCDALAHAHSRGVIHRDIKPHNILITRDGNVKVADFGIARAATGNTITYGANVIGSVHYVSPEQARGEVVGPESDIYSLGCVVYEMLTGRVPFDGDSPVTVALKHIHEDPVPPRMLNDAISPALEKVVLTAIAKDPAMRYHSAEDFGKALVQAANGEGGATMGKKKARKVPAKKQEGKNKGTALIIAVAILGLLLGLGYSMRDQIFGHEVVVPDLTGMSSSEAYDALKKVDLKMRVVARNNSSEYPSGHVISQRPEGGSTVKSGREIEVVLSKGAEKTQVPDLTGKDLSEARAVLSDYKLEVGHVEKQYDDTVPANAVISQDPAAGKEVEEGSSVDLVVSQGKEPKTTGVPSVVGLYLSEAKAAIESAGLVLGEITREDSNEYFSGQVISQTPQSGQQAEEGSAVNVVVSKGPGPTSQQTTIRFTVPVDQDYYQVQMILSDVKGEREVYRELLQGGDTVEQTVSYYGRGEVRVYLNSQLFRRYAL